MNANNILIVNEQECKMKDFSLTVFPLACSLGMFVVNTLVSSAALFYVTK
jgi:hypothetical protein